MEIGKKLKNARVQSGMTQENVAEKINVSRQTISNWENEKSYPDIISVIELSNLYSISLDFSQCWSFITTITHIQVAVHVNSPIHLCMYGDNHLYMHF